MLLIVLLAMYSSFGRLLLGNLSQYQPQLLSALNARTGLALNVDSLTGSWRSLSPSITATGLRMLGSDKVSDGLLFEQVEVEIDVFGSLRSLSPRLFMLRARGGELHLEVSAEGRVNLMGLAPTGQGPELNAVLDFLFNAEALTLDKTRLIFHYHDDVRETFVEGRLQREGDYRRARLSVQAPSRKSLFQLIAEGEGKTRGLDGFEGLLHLHTRVGDLSLYSDLAAMTEIDDLAGELTGDFWLKVDRGEFSLVSSLDAAGLSLRPTSDARESLSLDALSVTAATEWTDENLHFRAKDLRLSRQGNSVTIDRLSGQFGEDGLTLRLADLRLGTLAAYLRGAGLLPDTAEDVLAKLSPSGRIATAEFSLNELSGARDWQLAMNFSDLDVEPWRGAPGLVNAAGYAVLTADTGRVQLGSSDFSMAFPKVFKEPLHYAAVTGELAWLLDEEAFRLRSGPISASAEEGDIRGLFSLKIPRVEMPAGAEMHLMVSIRNSESRFRDKYLTYKLNPDLLAWLEDGVDAGTVLEAGFIYRGALIRRPEYRSVQLYLDVDDTRIDYHPEWPEAEAFSGLILVDNVDVDAFGRAQILSSAVENAHIALRPNPDKSLRLFLTADMQGSAQDGLDIVNGSPLRDLIGDSFANWELAGELDARLSLAMDLRENLDAPSVRLRTHWRDVNIHMRDVDLLVENITGQLFYDTPVGFSGKSISGSLWGEPFQGEVRQGRSGNALNDLDIKLQGAVTAESVQRWLELPTLQLAQGRTQAELHVVVPTGVGQKGEASQRSLGSKVPGAHLQVESKLRGVSLDLPAPWGKNADSDATLKITMPLSPGPRRLSMSLDSETYLDLDLSPDGLTGGALGFGAPLNLPRSDRIWIGGRIERLDWATWEAFLDRYFPEGEGSPVLAGIQDLRVDELLLFERQFSDVSLGGLQSAESWRLDFDTAWVTGSATLPDALDQIDLALTRLELQGFTAFMEAENGASDSEALPLTTISINQLYDGDDLWGELNFTLREDGPNLHFENIRGELWHLSLGAEEGMQLDWLEDETGSSGEQTRLQGVFSFRNFGETLSDFNYEEIVETEAGKVSLDVTWPGDPVSFDLNTVAGQLSLNAENGRFLKTSGATEGTLRVVGILNLTEIVRRLSLDLSNVYKSGVPFDTLQGDLRFQAGHIDVPNIDVRSR
ncbi:MAG: DUF3971 domain-containing protein, partial [Pseudomonadota bacterium]